MKHIHGIHVLLARHCSQEEISFSDQDRPVYLSIYIRSTLSCTFLSKSYLVLYPIDLEQIMFDRFALGFEGCRTWLVHNITC